MIFKNYFMYYIKMTEIWKKIKDYSNYEVSNTGKIRNINLNKELKLSSNTGYLYIFLSKNNKRSKGYIHRLVAESFLEKTNDKLVVNHKDGNKENNNIENLEWITQGENVKHAIDNELLIHFKLSVNQYTDEDEFIKTYESVEEASRQTNINGGSISLVCKGKRKTAGGFIWKYTNELNTIKEKPDGIEVKDFPNYLITKDGKVYSKKRQNYIKPQKQGNICRVKLQNNNILKSFCIHNLVKYHFEISTTPS
jgi:hypothetical protein